MNRGRNELLDAVYNEIERADFRAEMIFTAAVFLAVILVGVYL